MTPPLRIILVINAIATLAAAIVLALAPNLIPFRVGIAIPQGSRFVTDLLAAAELGFAVLAMLALRARTGEALRLTVWTLITLHAASGLFGLLALAQGLGGAVGTNVLLRIVMVALLCWFGLRQPPRP